MKPSRLLYPVGKKDYESDPLIKSQWDAAKEAIQSSLLFTVFGYSAPISDAAARGILKDAWQEENGTELIRQIEIIDTKKTDKLALEWKDFAFHQHYDIWKNIKESLLGKYPRRSCEALRHMDLQGNHVESFPFKQNLDDLQTITAHIISFE